MTEEFTNTNKVLESTNLSEKCRQLLRNIETFLYSRQWLYIMSTFSRHDFSESNNVRLRLNGAHIGAGTLFKDYNLPIVAKIKLKKGHKMDM